MIRRVLAVEGVRDALVLGLLALVLFSLGVDWGLPAGTGPSAATTWAPDELAPVGSFGELYNALIVRTEPYGPQYPLFHYFVASAFCAPYLLALLIGGGLASPAPVFPFGLADPATSLPILTILARIPSLAMAAATVTLASFTARTLWRDRGAALVAGGAILVTVPLTYYARTSNVDAPALFWTGAGLAVFAIILRTGLTSRRAVWLGVFAALAVATKDASYATFAAIAPVVVWRGRRSGRTGTRAIMWGLGAAILVYAFGSGLVLNPARYADHVRFILGGTELPAGVDSPFYGSVGDSWIARLGLARGAVRLLADSLGWPLLALSMLGLGLCLVRDRAACWLMLPALGLFVGVILPAGFVQIRFLLPVAYGLALMSGFAVAAARDRGSARRLALVAAGAAIMFGGVGGVDLTRQMRNDSRVRAAVWLSRNLTPGDTLGYYGAALKLPRTPPSTVSRPMAGQLVVEPGTSIVERPPFVIVVPQQDFEPAHEWTLPPERFAALLSGASGYRQMVAIQTPVLLGGRPIPFVNPPVRIFVREDVVPRLPDGDAPLVELEAPGGS